MVFGGTCIFKEITQKHIHLDIFVRNIDDNSIQFVTICHVWVACWLDAVSWVGWLGWVIYTCKKHSVCIVRIFASICMHWQHDVCVFEKVPPSNHMHEVARNRAAFRKSKPGRMELVNPLVSTPVRGFTGIYIYTYIYICYYVSIKTERAKTETDR